MFFFRTLTPILWFLSLSRAFDEFDMVADAFFPVKGHVHSARATEDARVGAFHVSRTVSWVRLQGFSFALATELESLMVGAIGRFLAFQVECSRDDLALRGRAPAPSSNALHGLVGAVWFASRDEGGFVLLGLSCLIGARLCRRVGNCKDNGFSGEFAAVSIHALLPGAFDFFPIFFHTKGFLLEVVDLHVLKVLTVAGWQVHFSVVDSQSISFGLAEGAVKVHGFGAWSLGRQVSLSNHNARRHLNVAGAFVMHSICRRECGNRQQDADLVDGVHYVRFSSSSVSSDGF